MPAHCAFGDSRAALRPRSMSPLYALAHSPSLALVLGSLSPFHSTLSTMPLPLSPLHTPHVGTSSAASSAGQATTRLSTIISSKTSIKLRHPNCSLIWLDSCKTQLEILVRFV